MIKMHEYQSMSAISACQQKEVATYGDYKLHQE